MLLNTEDIIKKAINRFNEENGKSLVYDKNLSLFGSKSPIDSLALVQLIVVIEEEIENGTGKDVTLVNEKAMSLKNSPFRNVRSLETYIGELLIDGK